MFAVEARRSLLRAIDMPAREAMARRSALSLLAPALLGAALVAACSLAAKVIGPPQPWGIAKIVARLDLLRAIFEALVVVVPSAAVLASYARLAIPARAVLASYALGLLIAGVVTLATLPLIAFLGLVAREQPMVSPSLLFPPLALATIAATVSRIGRAIDPSPRARFTFALANFSLFAVFAVRGLALL